MKTIHFTISPQGTLALSKKPQFEDNISLRTNEMGDFMKALRLRNNLSKFQVARLLNFRNIDKTIRNIGAIEENSRYFPEYTEKLLSIYKSSMEEFLRVKRKQANLMNLIKKKHAQLLMRRRQKKASFYLKLIQQLSFFFAHFEEIMNTPEYYFVPLFDCSVSSAFISRGRENLYFGEILTLWKNRLWIATCEECNGEIYLTNIGGNPISGMGGCSGFCANCKRIKTAEEPFYSFFRQVIELPVKYQPEDLDFITIETLIEKLEN